MNYTIVRNGVVTNVIVGPLPAGLEGVPAGDVPAGIGDVYADGVFSRDGVALLTPLETAEATIAELDAAVLELEIATAMMALEM